MSWRRASCFGIGDAGLLALHVATGLLSRRGPGERIVSLLLAAWLGADRPEEADLSWPPGPAGSPDVLRALEARLRAEDGLSFPGEVAARTPTLAVRLTVGGRSADLRFEPQGPEYEVVLVGEPHPPTGATAALLDGTCARVHAG